MSEVEGLCRVAFRVQAAVLRVRVIYFFSQEVPRTETLTLIGPDAQPSTMRVCGVGAARRDTTTTSGELG